MDRASMVDGGRASSVIEVRGLEKRYGKRRAVRNVDLEVVPNEIYGLIGPDGAGKSTLMKAVAGILAFDHGSVRVFETEVRSERSAEKIKDRIGFLPQGLGENLYRELSVEENIDFFARLRGLPRADLDQRKKRLLRMARLTPFGNRPVKNLSGGMKQKLGLVCVLIHHPELLVLDEPTTGVDPVSRREFWAILTELLREQGITALVSTAYMEEATRFHRISLLHQGQTLARGQPDAILKQASGSLVVVEAQDQMKALKRLQENFSQVEALGPWLRVFVDQKNPESARRVVRSAIEEDSVRRVESAEPSLEDVFMALVRKHQEQGERSRQKKTDVVYGGGAFEAEEGSAIRAENLVRAFDSFRAVDGVSFEVRHGEIFGLLGPNGAGKTTVIKMLTGIMPPSGGSGHVAGADMRGASRAIKNRIGYMSQVFSLYQDLSVVENIHLYAGVYGLGRREARERADWVVGLADLAGYEREHTGRLPMGMRQRLALGCALVHRPRILFLDEPTSGVDPAGRHRFWEILFRLSRRDKVTLLVTTHYMNEAEHCDRLALMHQGRIIASASPGEMKRRVEEDAGKLLEVEACPPLEALQILKDSGFESASLFGNRIHLLTPDPEASERALRGKLQDQGMEVISVQRKPLTMEDVFVQHILSQEAEP